MKRMLAQIIGYYLNSMALLAPQIAGRHAFGVFCYPARKPLKKHQKVFLDSADKFYFNHKNTLIQGYRWGQGPKKVLFFHGWQSHSFRWKNYIQALPVNEYTIYAIDAPGHGLSKGSFLTVPLYSDLMQQFISSFGSVDTVVSHSIGSFSMLHALAHAPALPVKKLVIMGAPGEVEDFLGLYKSTLNLTDLALKSMKAHFQKAVGKPVSYFSAESFASRINVPGLIIHDKKDAEAPYHYAVQINKEWTGSKLLTTEDFGHNLKSPSVVEAVVEYIIEGTAPVANGVTPVERMAVKQEH